MTKPNYRKELAKLRKARREYSKSIESMELLLASKVDFEFSIEYQNSDGFVIAHNTDNAPIDFCLDLINDKGTLSEEDYFKICI